MSLVKPGEGFGFNKCGNRSCQAPGRFHPAELTGMAGPSGAVTGLRGAYLMANPAEDVPADVEVMSSLGVWNISFVKYF